jgi:hypothetical protein
MGERTPEEVDAEYAARFRALLRNERAFSFFVNYNDVPGNFHDPIWRYLDLARLLHLLQIRGLFLPKLRLLPDLYEGSMTSATAHYLRSTNRIPLRVYPLDGPERTVESAELELIGRLAKSARDTLCVSCWHENTHESDAMWRLYADRGFALVSTFKRLTESLGSSPDVTVIAGKVRYVDFDREIMEMHRIEELALYKRRNFAHEREIRIVRRIPDRAVSGTVLRVDLSQLIHRLVVAPGAEPWLFDVAKRALSDSGLSVPIERSTLYDAP